MREIREIKYRAKFSDSTVSIIVVLSDIAYYPSNADTLTSCRTLLLNKILKKTSYLYIKQYLHHIIYEILLW